MANNKLGKITLPPQPQPSPNPQEYVRNVGIWTREVEQAIRQIERALQGIDDNFTSKEDFDTLSNRVNSLNTGSSGGGGSRKNSLFSKNGTSPFGKDLASFAMKLQGANKRRSTIAFTNKSSSMSMNALLDLRSNSIIG